MRNEEMRLSEHFTLGELCKTKTGIENVPNEAQVENLKRVCQWLEELRRRWDKPIIINSVAGVTFCRFDLYIFNYMITFACKTRVEE